MKKRRIWFLTSHWPIGNQVQNTVMTSDPYPEWRALKPGYFELNGEALNMHVLSLGELPIPSGRLIVKDSNAFGYGPQRAIPVIPSAYPIKATCVEQGSLSMLAYLSIEVSSEPSASWCALSPTHVNEPSEDLPERLQGGFLNRSAYGIMVDESLLKEGLPVEDEHCYSLLCHWQNHIEDTKPIWEGARYDFHSEQNTKPLVVFRTHQMTGMTRMYGELDELGLLCRIHVDLGLMSRLHQKAKEES